MPKKIIAIVGAYRRGKTIDTAVDELLNAARQSGCQTEKISLLDKHIEFCANCRNCTQQPDVARGDCVISDDMRQILDKIDSADAIVLASPINWFNVTALMKRFIERLVCYGYWPWGSYMPRNRIKKLTKKAVIITSSGCPEFFGRISFRGTFFVLKSAANGIGAKVVKKIYIGLAAVEKDPSLPEKYRKQAIAAGKALSR
ncbi:MAG: flavodoxin family protein [Sedimentisphaerales bacterium]